MRKNSAGFMAKAVLEILEEKSVAETDSEQQIHPYLLNRRKRGTIKNIPRILQANRSKISMGSKGRVLDNVISDQPGVQSKTFI